jgi:hypothetical protein
MKPAQKQSKKPRPPVRVRYDPPTLEEAVFAAQGLSEDLPQQVEIAAGLMGVPEDDVRSLVMKAAMQKKMTAARQVFVADRGGAERAVVIERKTVRRRMIGAPPLRHSSIGPMR